MNLPVIRLLLVLCLAATLCGCGRSSESESEPRHYETRGIVRGFAPDQTTIVIEHENIPGFMPSMTMPFSAKEQQEIPGLRIGDAVSFRLSVTDRKSWIQEIKKINAEEVQLPPAQKGSSPPPQSALLRPGDAMPDFALIDHDERTITLESFHGRPFLLTFIFTRCPIPNFCPLMTRHFEALQKRIKSGAGSLAETRLLSISFDPAYDTPAILKEYAKRAEADGGIWSFASGSNEQVGNLAGRFSVRVLPRQAAGMIAHELCTALVGRDGRIVEIWRGNEWTPEEALNAVQTRVATQADG